MTRQIVCRPEGGRVSQYRPPWENQQPSGSAGQPPWAAGPPRTPLGPLPGTGHSVPSNSYALPTAYPQQVGPQPQPGPYPYPQPRKRKRTGLVVGILALVLVLVGAAVLVSRLFNREPYLDPSRIGEIFTPPLAGLRLAQPVTSPQEAITGGLLDPCYIVVRSAFKKSQKMTVLQSRDGFMLAGYDSSASAKKAYDQVSTAVTTCKQDLSTTRTSQKSDRPPRYQYYDATFEKTRKLQMIAFQYGNVLMLGGDEQLAADLPVLVSKRIDQLA